MNKDIALKCIELVFAFKNNDLNNTKIIVDYFNNLDTNGWQKFLCQSIDFGNIINNLETTNIAIEYFIKHIKNFSLQEELEWKLIAKNLILSKSIIDIENFLMLNINNIQDYKKPYLTQLCVISDRYDLLHNFNKQFNRIEKDGVT